MTLYNGIVGKEYIVDSITTDDEEMNNFLFTLGCYSGEPIRVVAKRSAGVVVMIKDGRYNLDLNLAQLIYIKEF